MYCTSRCLYNVLRKRGDIYLSGKFIYEDQRYQFSLVCEVQGHLKLRSHGLICY